MLPTLGKKYTISQHYKPCLSPFVCSLKCEGAQRTQWITGSWMEGIEKMEGGLVTCLNASWFSLWRKHKQPFNLMIVSNPIIALELAVDSGLVDVWKTDTIMCLNGLCSSSIRSHDCHISLSLVCIYLKRQVQMFYACSHFFPMLNL